MCRAVVEGFRNVRRPALDWPASRTRSPLFVPGLARPRSIQQASMVEPGVDRILQEVEARIGKLSELPTVGSWSPRMGGWAWIGELFGK